MDAKKWSKRKWFAAALCVLAMLGLGNARVLTGSVAPQWDAVDFFGPEFSLVGDEIRAGRLLKWNPWVGGGSPDFAEPELGTTSPILLAATFLSPNPQAGYVGYWMAVWAFGGIGMLLFARHLGCNPWGGVVAACGFAASGFYTGHAEHMSSIYSVSFLPWILWRLDAGLQSSSRWYGVQAGALYGLSALGGYPAFTILTPGFLFLWTAGRVLWNDDGARPHTKRPGLGFSTLLLALAVGLGFVIFSPPYSGILSATRGYSDHIGPRPRDVSISSNLLSAGALSTFASPYLANLNFPPREIWPETNISMTSIYAGAASLVLAVFGWRRRSGWRWWLILIGAFFACCALGSQLPLRGWLYDFVPPTRYFRNPALFRAYVILVIAVLAAMATRDVVESPRSDADGVRLWLISIFLACSSTVSFHVISRLAAKATPELRAGTIHLVFIWFGLAAIAYVCKEDLLSRYNFVRFAAALAFLDGLGSLYISRPTLSTSATVPWWHEMNVRHTGTLDRGPSALPRILHPPEFFGSYPNNRNLLNKTAVFDGYITLWNRFQQQMVADDLLSAMATGSDRFWFSSAVLWRAPDNASFKVFRDRLHELAGTPILLLHSPEQMLALSPAGAPETLPRESLEPQNIPACVLAAVSDVSYAPESLSFQYVAPASGYLLVTDRWAPGWEVTVNDRRQPVLGSNFIFRAVQVQAGTNIIKFRYNPQGFWPLLIVSWGTLIAIVAWQCRMLIHAGYKTSGGRTPVPHRSRPSEGWHFAREALSFRIFRRGRRAG